MKAVVLNFTAAAIIVFLAAIQIVISVQRLRNSRIESEQLGSATAMIIRRAEQATEGSFIIHKPQSGCPAGWEELPKAFTEENGSTRAGCWLAKSQNGGVTTDYLKPGESF